MIMTCFKVRNFRKELKSESHENPIQAFLLDPSMRSN